eukprot:Selendium_serpulae@DN4972_c1_g1_i3.p1
MIQQTQIAKDKDSRLLLNKPSCATLQFIPRSDITKNLNRVDGGIGYSADGDLNLAFLGKRWSESKYQTLFPNEINEKGEQLIYDGLRSNLKAYYRDYQAEKTRDMSERHITVSEEEKEDYF